MELARVTPGDVPFSSSGWRYSGKLSDQHIVEFNTLYAGRYHIIEE
jgi:hypothetical protein